MFTFDNESSALIPAPITGITTDVKEEVNFESHGDARNCWLKACERLKEVNGWNELMGLDYNQYQLFGKDGKEKTGQAKKGDFIRFAPKSELAMAKEYHWVRIERILNLKAVNKQCFGMQVKSSLAPGRFTGSVTYTRNSSCTFVAEVSGHTLRVGIHPEHEKIDTVEREYRPGGLVLLFTTIKTWLGISPDPCTAFLMGLTHA